MSLKCYCFFKCLSTLFVSFLAKNQKIFEFGKFRQYDEETEYFEKKNASSFKKASSPKCEDGKYAGVAKLPKVANLLLNGHQMILFHKNVFSVLIMIFFWQKIRKFLKLEK